MERGRPRGFDTDVALDQALRVFWRDGFQAASLSALTEAMGISKPSLYAAFGDKESLYLRALERYRRTEGERRAQALGADPDVRHAVESYLLAYVRSLTDPAKPGGCFVLNGTADCDQADTPPAIRDALRSTLKISEEAIKARLQRGVEDAQLPRDTDTAALAAFFFAVMSGLAILGKNRAPRAKLTAIVKTAMQSWPGGNPSGSAADR